MVPALAVIAATKIIARFFWKPRSAVYAVFRLQWTAARCA
jgi:hypothetical protein